MTNPSSIVILTIRAYCEYRQDLPVLAPTEQRPTNLDIECLLSPNVQSTEGRPLQLQSKAKRTASAMDFSYEDSFFDQTTKFLGLSSDNLASDYRASKLNSTLSSRRMKYLVYPVYRDLLVGRLCHKVEPRLSSWKHEHESYRTEHLVEKAERLIYS